MQILIDLILGFIFNRTYGRVNEFLQSLLSGSTDNSQTTKLKYINSRLNEK